MKGWPTLAAHWHFQCLTWQKTGITSPCQHLHSHSWEPFTQQAQLHPHSLSWLQNTSALVLLHHMQAQSQNSTATHPHPSVPWSWDTASSGNDARWAHWETQSLNNLEFEMLGEGSVKNVQTTWWGWGKTVKSLILGKGLALLHSKT